MAGTFRSNGVEHKARFLDKITGKFSDFAALSVLLVVIFFAFFQQGGSTALASENPYIGEIMFFGGNFCPRGWAVADGTTLKVENHNALFSLYGNRYGGDGVDTFALPQLPMPDDENVGPLYCVSLMGSLPSEENLDGYRSGDYEPFIGEIVLFAANFCPAGWAPTQGDFFAIPVNTALFTILGLMYGGDGVNSFALPDLPPPVSSKLRYCIAFKGVYPSR